MSGTITAIAFLAVSTIVLEGFGAGDKLFQRWAETNWYAPFEAHTRMDAVKKSLQTIEDNELHLGNEQKPTHALPFYAVEGGTSPPDRYSTLDEIKETNDPFVVGRAPQAIRAGQEIMGVYLSKGEIAETDGYVMVWDGTVWGFVPVQDYKSASLAMEDLGSR